MGVSVGLAIEPGGMLLVATVLKFGTLMGGESGPRGRILADIAGARGNRNQPTGPKTGSGQGGKLRITSALFHQIL